jgi:uncharacterized protein YegL
MSDELEQQPFALAEFADNPEPRCPCVLLLDTSASMTGRPIQELNDALMVLREDLLTDSLASKRVELAIISFGPVQVLQDFLGVEYFSLEGLHASGDTPLAEAIQTGLDLLRLRKETLRGNGIKLFRPWIFLITDGAPTDNWHHIPQQIKDGEERGSFSFFAVGVTGADMNTLRQIAVREPISLSGLKFKEFFLWLSASLKNVSHSQPGDKVALPDYKPYGWAEV